MSDRIFVIDDLHLTITEKCNLNCGHCFRGKKGDCTMTKEVIEHSLKEVKVIRQLLLGGGEPMLAPQTILEILDYIMKNNIFVTRIGIVTNGTIYHPDVVKALKKFSDYMIKKLKLKENSIIDLSISKDYFHDEQINSLNLEKEVRTYESKYKVYFNVGYQYLGKILKEGNAENLPGNESFYNIVTTPIIFGAENEHKAWPTHIGPIVTINPKGIITERSTSFEHQETIYNYGNILETPFSKMMEKQGSLPWNDFCDECNDFIDNRMISNDSITLKKSKYFEY